MTNLSILCKKNIIEEMYCNDVEIDSEPLPQFRTKEMNYLRDGEIIE